MGSTSLASQALPALQPDQVNSLPLNASGLAAINQGGRTQLGLRLGLDLNNQTPVGQAEVVISVDGMELMVTYEESAPAQPAPVLTQVEPDRVEADALTPLPSTFVTLRGDNLRTGAVAYLLREALSYRLTDVDVRGSTSILARVPVGVPPGLYDVLVANSDGRWARLTGAFTVTPKAWTVTSRVYLPALARQSAGW